MSAAVESQRALNGRLNGHRAEDDARAINGYHDARPWAQQFLPSPLRLDDNIRAQKVISAFMFNNLAQ